MKFKCMCAFLIGLCAPQIIIRLCSDDLKLKGTYPNILSKCCRTVYVLYFTDILGSINLATGSQVILAEFHPSFSFLGIQVSRSNFISIITVWNLMYM